MGAEVAVQHPIMSLEPPPLARDVDVLEHNKLLAHGLFAAQIVGFLLFATFVADLFPAGMLGFHLAIVGLLLGFANKRFNLRATRRRAAVKVGREGLWEGARLIVARRDIADGFFQPRAGRDRGDPKSYGSSVRLVDKRRRVLFEAEADEAEATAILRALGLDAESKRAQFNGPSPLYATTGRNLLFLAGVVAFTVVLGTLLLEVGVGVPMIPLLALPLVFAGMMPAKVEVGVDGILQRWLWTRKFIPIAQIATVTRRNDCTIHVQLRDGREEPIYTSAPRRDGFGASLARQHRDAIFARINETLVSYRARGPAPDVSAMVAKGTRSRGDWLAALEELCERPGGYRDAVVRDEDLWRLIEDPSAPGDARGAAALLLRGSLDDAGRARVRVASDATASPKLRVALDAAAGEGNVETLRAALEELAGEDEDVGRPNHRRRPS